MRSLLVVVCVLGIGCGTKEDPRSRRGSASGPILEAKPPPVDDYDARMTAGTALEDQRKWQEALAEFEAALNARAGDARALAEIGFTAYHAGKLPRAREASETAILAATDVNVRGAAMYNLGRAIEDEMPAAAATLYVESNAIRPDAAVRRRLARLQRDKTKDLTAGTPDGDALLARLQLAAAKLPPARPAAKPLDQALIDALDAAGVPWDSGAGKSVLRVENLACVQRNGSKPATYECTSPAVKDELAQAIVDNLVARKLAPKQEPGEVVTFTASEVRCVSPSEGDGGKPDTCTVTR